MVLLPWQVVTFLSPLSPGDVQARLATRTQGADLQGRKTTPGKFLEGTIQSRLFRVRPLGRRWSAIVARGRVHDAPGGSRIDLLVRPSLAGGLFMAVMLGGAFAAAAAATVLSQRKGSVPPNLLAVWILPFVGWALLTSAMRRDGARMARVLGELLEGRAAPGAAGASR